MVKYGWHVVCIWLSSCRDREIESVITATTLGKTCVPKYLLNHWWAKLHGLYSAERASKHSVSVSLVNLTLPIP